MGKGKGADVYLEVRKRRGAYIFLNETSACGAEASFSSVFLKLVQINFIFAYIYILSIYLS